MCGYKITLCFSDENNQTTLNEVKKLLLNSYKIPAAEKAWLKGKTVI